VRAGTLLEEQASTAHSVGLKHTILLAFVTLGSVINFCDCLMAGGSSRKDHSEVGSGFIHFNFTPWGERGDKATPSLVGDVPRGVFYRERRIFLGGSGGMIGPRSVGFGSVAAAGQVIRHDIEDDRLVLRTPPRIDRELRGVRLDGGARAHKNVEYIANLVALRSFYRVVRLGRSYEGQVPVLEAAISVLDAAIGERTKRLESFMSERGREMPTLELEPRVGACPLELEPGSASAVSHLEYIAALDDSAVAAGSEWLRAIVDRVQKSAR
jgi:UDP-N-acetylglucosamine/UDP-N-acetylgalactosamine diphosphorylase